ncbi:MAG: hypothetical protein J0I12_11175 [Candidatus Eremiobacteraeota bacterium]|nr:hypothetical protein [Candidatus Eremiobacteraeota bacterium]
MIKLTARQEQVLAYVSGYITTYHCSPSAQEVSDYLGIRRTAGDTHLKALVTKGSLVRVRGANGQPRGWRLPG